MIYNPRQAGAIVGGHTAYVAMDSKQAKALTGFANSITPSKKVEVVSGDNQFDLKREDFTVERQVKTGPSLASKTLLLIRLPERIAINRSAVWHAKLV